MQKVLLFVSLLFSFSTSGAQTDTLSTFIAENPNAVELNVIYKGTKMNLAADDEFLLVNLSVAHPALLMRFLMQGTTIYIDPSGKKRRNYEVVLPSAFDVKDEVGAAPEEMGGVPASDNADERPEIRPLIQALNRHGATFNVDGQATYLGMQQFYIELDQENNCVNYYVLLPKATLMEAKKMSTKWSLGIFSINDMNNMPPMEGSEGPSPEGGMGAPPANRGGGQMMPPASDDEDQEVIQKLMQSDIREWVKFSIDDVNNANLKE